MADPQPRSRAKARPTRTIFYIDPLAARLRLDPYDVIQQLRARVTEEIKSVSPDLRRHAAQPSTARVHVVSDPFPLMARTLCKRSSVTREGQTHRYLSA